MATRCTLFLLIPLLTTLANAQDSLTVTTSHGQVKGKVVEVPNGGKARAFLGIPFAKPPVGNLRYLPPQAPEAWEGVRDATALPNNCIQLAIPNPALDLWNLRGNLSEDCLYLNVWTPYSDGPSSGSPLPVLVWIYGGAYTSGSITLRLYDGSILSRNEEVIIVAVNYRVGAFGFLSIPGDEMARGNLGLRDQRQGLQWVADNIAAFGGDPAKVTLFGESAGSASVGSQVLSPGSKTLFVRAIMESGSPNAHWATLTMEQSWARTYKLAAMLKCPTDSPSKLKECLQNADAMTISKMQMVVFPAPTLALVPFPPVVDGDFFPASPETLLMNGDFEKKELIIGTNKDEGTVFLTFGVPGIDGRGENPTNRENFMVGVNMSMPDLSEIAKQAAVLHYTYWADVDNGIKNRDNLGQLVGDYFFGCPLKAFAHWYTYHGGKVFFYHFIHRSSTLIFPQWMGVMHGFEIEFIFGHPLNPSLGYTAAEVAMTRRLMKHWSTFAKTGNPTYDAENWPMYSNTTGDYVVLDTNPLQVKQRFKAQLCRLWNNYVPEVQRLSDELSACSGSTVILLSGKLLAILLMVALFVY